MQALQRLLQRTASFFVLNRQSDCHAALLCQKRENVSIVKGNHASNGAGPPEENQGERLLLCAWKRTATKIHERGLALRRAHAIDGMCSCFVVQ